MTTKKPAQRATPSAPKTSDTVGDVAEQKPTSDTAAPAAPAENQNTDVGQSGDPAEQVTPNAADSSGDSATSEASTEPAAEQPKPEAPKPSRKATKPKRLDPADDPTAGITGVPVDYVPTPAVP